MKVCFQKICMLLATNVDRSSLSPFLKPPFIVNFFEHFVLSFFFWGQSELSKICSSRPVFMIISIPAHMRSFWREPQRKCCGAPVSCGGMHQWRKATNAERQKAESLPLRHVTQRGAMCVLPGLWYLEHGLSMFCVSLELWFTRWGKTRSVRFVRNWPWLTHFLLCLRLPSSVSHTPTHTHLAGVLTNPKWVKRWPERNPHRIQRQSWHIRWLSEISAL